MMSAQGYFRKGLERITHDRMWSGSVTLLQLLAMMQLFLRV